MKVLICVWVPQYVLISYEGFHRRGGKKKNIKERNLICGFFDFYVLCLCLTCHLLLSTTDETSSSLLLHLQELILSNANNKRTQATFEWCSDASGAISSPWWWQGHPSGSGARWGAWCSGSEGVWPLHALDNERAAGAGRQGSGVCTEVSNILTFSHIIIEYHHTLVFF